MKKHTAQMSKGFIPQVAGYTATDDLFAFTATDELAGYTATDDLWT